MLFLAQDKIVAARILRRTRRLRKIRRCFRRSHDRAQNRRHGSIARACCSLIATLCRSSWWAVRSAYVIGPRRDASSGPHEDFTVPGQSVVIARGRWHEPAPLPIMDRRDRIPLGAFLGFRPSPIEFSRHGHGLHMARGERLDHVPQSERCSFELGRRVGTPDLGLARVQRCGGRTGSRPSSR